MDSTAKIDPRQDVLRCQASWFVLFIMIFLEFSAIFGKMVNFLHVLSKIHEKWIFFNKMSLSAKTTGQFSKILHTVVRYINRLLSSEIFMRLKIFSKMSTRRAYFRKIKRKIRKSEIFPKFVFWCIRNDLRHAEKAKSQHH